MPQIGRLDHIGLGLPQKSRQMDEINAVLAVIILRQADNPARAVAYRPLDAPLPLQWSQLLLQHSLKALKTRQVFAE